VVTALYRRYRPETFAELIGQSQVTDPLRTALRTDRVGHAYLFSGPRGCGKTTSARILARCLNCAEGPTDTPCGVCPSCVELGRDGGGSLDVVEIDAASHGGVDDARDLRERAIFAPARDRYKIFIIDEAHMVTSGGFNALLKIVEEPPEHVKFIFATTEPEKVIGTIRSRTHHYPFRLVPPAQLMDYVAQLCASEGVEVEPGVLPLVVRAGGGSVRDTLSILDQLIAGSETTTIGYERAVALLGYTHGELLDEVVDALAERSAASVFAAVDRVVQTGQDPRRFVEDLLERLRDLIIVAASPSGAAALLRGVPQDQLDRMAVQAEIIGAAELSRAADTANAALTEMSGATSPRLHLELLAARLLLGGASVVDDAPRAAERPSLKDLAAAAKASTPVAERAERVEAKPVAAPGLTPPAQSAVGAGAAAEAHRASAASAARAFDQVKHAWPEVIAVLERENRKAWLAAHRITPRALDGDVLALGFPAPADIEAFKRRSAPGEGASDALRAAIVDVLGMQVKFTARVDAPAPEPAPEPTPDAPSAASGPTASSPAAVAQAAVPPRADQAPPPAPAAAAAAVDTTTSSIDWVVAQIPSGASDEAIDPEPLDDLPGAPAVPASAPALPERTAKVGEAVVRELLGAKFLEEQPIAVPAIKSVPVAGDDGVPPPTDADAPPDDAFAVPEDEGR
jgi:DNA polymerase-3 subunit gamma/tau